MSQEQIDREWHATLRRWQATQPRLTPALELQIAQAVVDTWQTDRADDREIYDQMIAAARTCVRHYWPEVSEAMRREQEPAR